MYTIKSMGAIEDGIAKRMETEVLLDDPIDAPAEIPVKQIRDLIDDIIYPRKLLEHIQVRTDRRRYRVALPKERKSSLPSMRRASRCGGFTNRDARGNSTSWRRNSSVVRRRR